MSNENQDMARNVPERAAHWQGSHVYLMATACLVVGLVVGYFLRGSQSPAKTPVAVAVQQASAAADPNQPPTMEQMKQMASKAVAPTLEKIKKNPSDFDALNEAGKVYRATHQFKEAAEYFDKALQVDPKNVAVRTDLASCLYYTGDVDGALAQLNKALEYDPKFYGALLNIGVIKMQAKKDVPGAISAWEKVLQTDADPKIKEAVKRRIADAKARKAETAAAIPQA